MNFDWTVEESQAKEKVEKLLKEAPTGDFQRLEEGEITELKKITGQYLKKLGDAGYLSLGLGPDGHGAVPALMAAQEEMAKASGSLFLAVEASARLFGGLLAGFGSGAEVASILDSVQQGGLIGAVAMSEPESAEISDKPDFVSATSGRLEGADYIVTGKKSFVTNGPIADCIAVFGEAGGRPVVFLVDPAAPGVEIGPRLKTLGYQGLAVSRLELKGARVPAEKVLGPFDNSKALDFLKLVQDMSLAMAAVGLLQRTTALRQGLRAVATPGRPTDLSTSGDPVQAGRYGDTFANRATYDVQGRLALCDSRSGSGRIDSLRKGVHRRIRGAGRKYGHADHRRRGLSLGQPDSTGLQGIEICRYCGDNVGNRPHVHRRRYFETVSGVMSWKL